MPIRDSFNFLKSRRRKARLLRKLNETEQNKIKPELRHFADVLNFPRSVFRRPVNFMRSECIR